MAWAKIDDQLHGHPKIASAWHASRAAVGLHLMAISYCAAYNTSGLVPVAFVESRLPIAREREAAIAALTAVTIGFTSPLWEPVDGGWAIHDWAEYNGSASTRARVSEARREAGRKGGQAKWRRERITRAMREAVARECGAEPGAIHRSACSYCEAPVDIDWTGGSVRFLDTDGRPLPELDHVDPLARGGAHHESNLVLACLSCNRSKGASRPLANASGAAPGKGIAPSPSPNPEGMTADAVSSDAVPAPDPEVVRLCDLHSQLSRARAGAPESSRRMLPTKTWHVEMDRLMRLDGWSAEQIEFVIRWVDRDSFWGPTCLSVESLRRNFAKFAARIKAEQQPKARPAGLTDAKNDARRARAEAAFGDLMTPTEPVGSDTIDGREAA